MRMHSSFYMCTKQQTQMRCIARRLLNSLRHALDLATPALRVGGLGYLFFQLVPILDFLENRFGLTETPELSVPLLTPIALIRDCLMASLIF